MQGRIQDFRPLYNLSLRAPYHPSSMGWTSNLSTSPCVIVTSCKLKGPRCLFRGPGSFSNQELSQFLKITGYIPTPSYSDGRTHVKRKKKQKSKKGKKTKIPRPDKDTHLPQRVVQCRVFLGFVDVAAVDVETVRVSLMCLD